MVSNNGHTEKMYYSQNDKTKTNILGNHHYLKPELEMISNNNLYLMRNSNFDVLMDGKGKII